MKQIQQLFLISVREFLREPEILFWAFVFPISLALVLGLAFDTNRTTQYPIGLSQIPPDVIKKFEQNPHLKIDVLENKDQVNAFLKKGKIVLYLEFHQNAYYVYYDKNYDNAKLAYLEVIKALSNSSKNQIIEKEIEIAGARYIDYFIPGLIAMGVMNSALWGIGWTFINMRIKKLLKIFSASPVNKNYFFIAFVFARGLLSIIENLLLVVIVSFFFKIPFLGNLFDLIFVYLVGYLSFSGIAIFAACRANTTVVGNGIINAITLPMMVFSGIFFSYHSFPEVLVQIIQYLPLTILADLIRGIFLEGITWKDYIFPLSILAFQGWIFYLVGKKYFLWK
jgi:ABC-2 type transport system permease protein